MRRACAQRWPAWESGSRRMREVVMQRICVRGSPLARCSSCTITPEVDPHRFILFPGCEFIKPKKHRIETITEWIKAFTIYMADMSRQYPEVVPEMLAYQLAVVNASEQYDGLYWRSYDVHYRVNAAASGNRSWSALDVDLYTRFFTGRAKAIISCAFCDSAAHQSDQCPIKPSAKISRTTPLTGLRKQFQGPTGQLAGRKRKWPGDVCYLYNSGGECGYRASCKFRHMCGVCGGKHPAKSCDKEQ